MVDGVKSLTAVDSVIENIISKTFPNYEQIIGKSYDWYWHTPKTSKADFVRLRRTDDGAAQITLKSTDKGDTTDRVEIDLKVDDYKQAYNLLTGIHGEPQKLSKRYFVYFLENDDTTVSVYQVAGDDRVFIEVEARTKKRVKEILLDISNTSEKYELFRVNKSLYDMFINQQSPQLKSISKYIEEDL